MIMSNEPYDGDVLRTSSRQHKWERQKRSDSKLKFTFTRIVIWDSWILNHNVFCTYFSAIRKVATLEKYLKYKSNMSWSYDHIWSITLKTETPSDASLEGQLCFTFCRVWHGEELRHTAICWEALGRFKSWYTYNINYKYKHCVCIMYTSKCTIVLHSSAFFRRREHKKVLVNPTWLVVFRLISTTLHPWSG